MRWLSQGVYRRLSPMGATNAGILRRSYVIAYNARWYNFELLSRRMGRAGERPPFASHRTEVGNTCLYRSMGAAAAKRSLHEDMFAFALWDRTTRTLHPCSMDRLRVKHSTTTVRQDPTIRVELSVARSPRLSRRERNRDAVANVFCGQLNAVADSNISKALGSAAGHDFDAFPRDACHFQSRYLTGTVCDAIEQGRASRVPERKRERPSIGSIRCSGIFGSIGLRMIAMICRWSLPLREGIDSSDGGCNDCRRNAKQKAGNGKNRLNSAQ